MSRYFYLGPWEWTSGDQPCWHAPEGTVGLLDLRPSTACAQAGGSQARNFGLFVADRYLPSEYDLLGEYDARMTPAQRDAIKTRLILTGLDADLPIDALWEVATLRADPDDQVRLKPIMPCSDGDLELHLGGFSLVKSRAFTGQADPSWGLIQRVIQNDYRRNRGQCIAEAALIRSIPEQARPAVGTPARNAQQQILALKASLASTGASYGDAQTLLATERGTHYLKMLGAYKLKYGMAEAAFIASDLPQEKARKPDTTIADDFNRDDADAMGMSAEGWSWNEVGGDVDIVNNRAVSMGGDWKTSRAEIDLSSDDAYSQGNIYGQLSGNSVCLSSSAQTCYATKFQCAPYNSIRICKFVAGSQTWLTSDLTSAGPVAGDVGQTRKDGSTITAYLNAVLKREVTDSSITGNTRAGLFFYFGSGAGAIDNFIAADLGAPPGTPTPTPNTLEAALRTIAPVYRLLAPEGAVLPYIVLTRAGGTTYYTFPGSGIESGRLEVAYCSRWAGNDADALDVMRLIVQAIDRRADWGIIVAREAGPRVRLVDGRILRVVMDFRVERPIP